MASSSSSSLYCLCLAALCILQAAIGEARPDFGTTQTFQPSLDVSALAAEIGALVNRLDDELNFTPTLLGGLAADYLPFFKTLAGKLIEDGGSLASTLASGALSTSGKDALFNSLNVELDELLALIVEVPEAWPNTLDRLLARQLYEALNLAFQALSDVKEQLGRLYSQLSPVSSEEEFDNTVFPQLLQALRLLRARLTLLVYVFQRAGSNIHEASDYYDDYRGYVNAIGEQLESASVYYGGNTTAALLIVQGEFAPVRSAYQQENEELEAGLVGPITNAFGYEGLVTALLKLQNNGPAILTTLVGADLYNAGTEYLTTIALAISNVFDGINDYPIEQTLADYLVHSDANAELCFHRVEAQATEVPIQAPIRVQECLDRERPRLCRLHELAIELASLQIADIQDVWENLETCTRLQHRRHRNKCVGQFSTIYYELGTAHLAKYEDFMQLIQQTLRSSAVRLSICLANIDFYSFGTVIPQLEYDLSVCTGCVGRTCPPVYLPTTEPPSSEEGSGVTIITDL